MGNFFLWYLVISVIGILSIPLVYKLFHALPGRGYGMTKPFGLLLITYLFWLLTSLQITRNDMGGILFAFLLFGILNTWLFIKN